jgi:4-amino-4-deoxy-L-arabinose transferase-like glycosyltransferase
VARRLAIGLVVVALAVRIGAAVAAFDTPIAFDPRDYDRYARSIASGHGFPEAYAPYGGPTAYRPPGFPAFLAVVYRLRGGVHEPPGFDAYFRGRYRPDQRQVNAARIGQALLGTLIVVLIGTCAFQLWGGRAALAAMGIAAIYPPLVLLGLSLFSEPLFIAFALGATAAALRARAVERRRLRWVVGSGVLAGLAWLTRSNGFVLLPALALLVWTGRPWRSRQALAAPLALVAAGLLTVAPWTIRNAHVMHSFIPVSNEAGYTLAGTYNATAAHSKTAPTGWIPAQFDPHNARLMRRAKDDVDLARIGMRLTRRYVGDHPLYVAKVAYCNTVRLVFLERLGCGRSGFGRRNFVNEDRVSEGVVTLAIVAFAVVALLALAGALTPAARRAPPALWLVPLLLGTVVLVVSGNRLRAPIEPFLIMLAGLALASRLRPRRA